MDFTQLIDLASENLGGAVLYANDDFFAPKENLIKPAAPVWKEGLYTDGGKWMDGWESRRRRSPRLEEPFDWCVIRLGMPGQVSGVVVDTAYFKGNFPSHCSLDACTVDGHPDIAQLLDASTPWKEILPLSELDGDSQNKFEISETGRVTHLRFEIYTDGGVARLRVNDQVLPDWNALRRRNTEIDLTAACSVVTQSAATGTRRCARVERHRVAARQGAGRRTRPGPACARRPGLAYRLHGACA